MFEQSPLPTLVLSPDLVIVDANAALCANTMTTHAQIMGRMLFDAFPINPNDPEADGETRIRESLARVAETLAMDMMPAQQYDVRAPDGRWVQKHWSLSHGAVLDANGKLAFIVQQSQDVTEYVVSMAAGIDRAYVTAELQARYDQTKLQSAARQEALLTRISADRKRLESLVQAKDDFLQTISHELKTPITTIRGNAEILRNQDAEMDRGDRASALRDIEFESVRLSRILDNLLLLARPELGGIEEDEPCLIKRVVERALIEHRRQFPARSVSLEYDATAMILVDCVETYAEQILQNLLANAEKYSPAPSPMSVSIKQDRGFAIVRVLDSGKGFTPDQAVHAFETYYRVGDERSEQAGIGIGLAVCKRLVEVMGGSIWAKSRPEGGAEVGFTIPLTADPQKPDLLMPVAS